MRPTKFLKKFFETFADNAAINHGESQLKAEQAARWFWNNLTAQEQVKLQITRIDALADKKKRKEFNGVCKEIRRRLFK